MKKIISLALAATALAGCGTLRPLATSAAKSVASAQSTKAFPVTPPMIQFITANGVMGQSFLAPPNYPVRFQCYATGTGFLQYMWTAYGPIFNYGNFADYTTPALPGTYDVQVWVRDQYGYQAERDVWIQVQPQAVLATATISDTDKATAKKGAVPPGASASPTSTK